MSVVWFIVLLVIGYLLVAQLTLIIFLATMEDEHGAPISLNNRLDRQMLIGISLIWPLMIIIMGGAGLFLGGEWLWKKGKNFRGGKKIPVKKLAGKLIAWYPASLNGITNHRTRKKEQHG